MPSCTALRPTCANFIAVYHDTNKQPRQNFKGLHAMHDAQEIRLSCSYQLCLVPVPLRVKGWGIRIEQIRVKAEEKLFPVSNGQASSFYVPLALIPFIFYVSNEGLTKAKRK